MSRSQLYKIVNFLAAFTAAACSQSDGIAPTSVQATRAPNQVKSELPVRPSSVGWHDQARALVAGNPMNPLAAARVYAALSVAEYRAVMSVDDSDEDGKLPENGIGAGGRAALEAHRGAVAGASAQVLAFFFPNAVAAIEQRVTSEGNAGPGNVHPEFTRGLALGRSAGNAMVDRLKNDHFSDPWTGTVPTGTGKWIANGPPVGATFGNVTPYLMNSGSQFRSPPPPAFDSPAFLTAVAEIKSISATRTAQQTAIALYWNFPGGTFTPPGYWDLTTGNYIESHNLDERAATHAFALTNAAGMDALIGCWDSKFYYWVIRPPQADPTITLSFGLPNHPSYPSGHSCGSAAAARVLAYLFPDRAAELDAWVTEAGLSRMYAGIHYRFDIEAGQNLGNAVGAFAVALDHQPGLLSAIH